MYQQATDKICWICGQFADSAEHTIKKSDLKALFGNVSQNSPIYFNSSNYENRKVQSIDSIFVKAKNSICFDCNNSKTQPYDRAWASMSEWLRKYSGTINVGDKLFGLRDFPLRTKVQRRNLQLYFVKLFGVRAKEGGIALPLSEFAAALRNKKPHPCIYLKFGRSVKTEVPIYAGLTDVHTIFDKKRLISADWIYIAGGISVLVMFCAVNHKVIGLKTSWHPRFSVDELKFYDFENDALPTK